MILPNVTDYSRSTLRRYRIHPPLFLQATGLLTSVWANSNNQVHLPVHLLSLFTWLINKQKFLLHLFAFVCSQLRITRVFITCSVQQRDSAACCVTQFLPWVRHSHVADLHVQSMNPELVTTGALRTVARSTLSQSYSQMFRTSRGFYSFSLSRGFPFAQFLLSPLDVQHCFLIICYLHHFTAAVFSSLYFLFLSNYNRLNR